MTQKISITLLLCLITGCASTYKHSQQHSLHTWIDPSKGVLISVPNDGSYGNTQYHQSGDVTANAIRTAFSKKAKKADVTKECKDHECLNTINTEKYGYYIKPTILHWEDRATEWSGIPDRIEIRLIVFDAITKEKLYDSSYTGKSKWATFGGDHPQDLLPEPTNEFVSNLYRLL